MNCYIVILCKLAFFILLNHENVAYDFLKESYSGFNEMHVVILVNLKTDD